jgi:hypothetical protein
VLLPKKGIGFNFTHPQGASLRSQARRPSILVMENTSLFHVLAWRFAKVSNVARTAQLLRQSASEVMSHAQIPALQ